MRTQIIKPTELKAFEELDVTSVARGIGRKATDEELINYLEKEKDSEPLSLDKAFSKYIFNQ
jgi:hypothetical protein